MSNLVSIDITPADDTDKFNKFDELDKSDKFNESNKSDKIDDEIYNYTELQPSIFDDHLEEKFENLLNKKLNHKTINIFDILKFSKDYTYIILLFLSVNIIVLDSLTKKLFLGFLGGGVVDLFCVILYYAKIKYRILYIAINIILLISYCILVVYLYSIDYCICLLNILLNEYLGGTIVFLKFQFIATKLIDYERYTYLYTMIKCILLIVAVILYFIL